MGPYQSYKWAEISPIKWPKINKWLSLGKGHHSIPPSCRLIGRLTHMIRVGSPQKTLDRHVQLTHPRSTYPNVAPARCCLSHRQRLPMLDLPTKRKHRCDWSWPVVRTGRVGCGECLFFRAMKKGSVQFKGFSRNFGATFGWVVSFELRQI